MGAPLDPALALAGAPADPGLPLADPALAGAPADPGLALADPAIALDGGFADPVFDAQRVFRAVMDALAHPGRIVALARPIAPPAPLPPAAGAVLATLADGATPLFLGALATRDVTAWLAFHTGAPVVTDPAAATFAAVPAADLRLADFAAGSAEYPDRSATVVVLAEALEGGPPLLLSGPGIAGTAELAPRGLPEDFAAQWAENGARFPLGIDLLLVAGERLAALPRTTRIAPCARLGGV